MNKINVIERKDLKVHNFEETNVFINSLLDSGRTVRYRESTRQRAKPRMLTYPHKESPHI